MQKSTNSRTPGFSTPQTNVFPLHAIAVKVARWKKYEIKAYNFFRFLVSSQYFKFTCCSTVTVVLGQVLSIVICGSQNHREMKACDAKLSNPCGH